MFVEPGMYPLSRSDASRTSTTCTSVRSRSCFNSAASTVASVSVGLGSQDVARELEDADRPELLGGRHRLVASCARGARLGSSASRTNPAFVPNDSAADGDADRARHVPGCVVGEGANVEHRRVARLGELVGLGRQGRATGRGSARRRARSSAAAASDTDARDEHELLHVAVTRARRSSHARGRSSTSARSSCCRRRASRRRGPGTPRRRRRAPPAARARRRDPARLRARRPRGPVVPHRRRRASRRSAPACRRRRTSSARADGPGCAGRGSRVAPASHDLRRRPAARRGTRAPRAVDRDGHAVLECEPAVPRHVVGVGVRLEHALDPHPSSAAASRYCSIAKGRVDDHRDTSLAVADQVRGAPEVVVHELPEEQHECGA